MRLRCLGIVLLLLAGTAMAGAADLALLPYPQQVTLGEGSLRLGLRTQIGIAGSSSNEDSFAAGLLADQLSHIDHVQAEVGRAGSGSAIVLARADTGEGRNFLHETGLSLPPEGQAEGYVLVVTARQAVVVADSGAGIFYGAQTLGQLFHPEGAAGAKAPAVRIIDWPAMRWRGVQIDMSRGPIPTLASIKRSIELLSEFKVNVLVFYFENTFAYQSLPIQSAFIEGAMKADEARAIVEFARHYHVDVIPEQESFGHMHLTLRYELYQDIADVPYGSMVSPAAPGSLDFLHTMLAELSQVFPSPFIHVGADETHDLGQGKSREMVNQKGEGEVYADFLGQINGILHSLDRRGMFWGDIAIKHPEMLGRIPHDMVALPWVYDAKPSFVEYIKPFRDAGFETWVAPGVNNWSRVFPNYAVAMANIRQFVADGQKLGADGVLNTTWMDDGESTFNFTWYGLVYGAAAGWESSDKFDDARFENAYDWAFYRADAHFFNDEIQKLNQIHQELQVAIHTDGEDWITWLDPFTERGQLFYREAEPAAHHVRRLAEEVLVDIVRHRSLARRNSDLLDYVAFGAERFDFFGEKAIYAKRIADLYSSLQSQDLHIPRYPGAFPSQWKNLYRPDPAEPQQVYRTLNGTINGINGLLQDMRDATTTLRRRYEKLWLAENHPYFLDNNLVLYDRERNLWLEESRAFSVFDAVYQTNHRLPPLIHPDLP